MPGKDERTNNKKRILLVTPPFVQPNTPYPASVYLCSFLKKRGYSVSQLDLSLQTLLSVFSSTFLNRVMSDTTNASRNNFFIRNTKQYCSTIDDVIRFLQGKDPTLAHRIVSRNFLPEGRRFDTAVEPKSLFDTTDYARYLATLYIEDIFDAIRELIDPDFGLTRYAESICTGISNYAVIQTKLASKPTLLETEYLNILKEHLTECKPDFAAFTVPFPGNLISALRCARFSKLNFPSITTMAGGGYVSTELGQIQETGLFDSIDYLVLDSGEKALLAILDGHKRDGTRLSNTIYRFDNRIVGGEREPFKLSAESLYPDYTDIDPEEYISLVDTQNPMMRLWNDGFWNKLTFAYGCYWKKCTFCDTSLDYINNFKPLSTDELLERIRTVKHQTGRSGFHFTDEAAPPSSLKKLALRLIQEGENISYWTNIRFEKSFDKDLCRLLALSGCIAVSGGLEVAGDRLLTLIQKGVSLEDVIRCTANFSSAGILVHSYLMYGFPTQTKQEIVDALETVRQLFAAGCIDSAYWHRFALTCHSYVYAHPDEFHIHPHALESTFARNDIPYSDKNEINYNEFGTGLGRALSSFMQREGLDIPVHSWFEHPVPETKIPPDYVGDVIIAGNLQLFPEKDCQFLAARIPEILIQKKNCNVKILSEGEEYMCRCRQQEGEMLRKLFNRMSIHQVFSVEVIFDALKKSGLNQNVFFSSEIWHFLRELCLIMI